MAVCNIFKALNKPTGSFLTFSQYSEDLTQHNAHSMFYKVVPSKFIAMDLHFQSENSNTVFPTILQNHFENACAIYKNNIEWNPMYSRQLFWNTMFDVMKLNISDIKYVGDINLQSYNEVDGMGYSEIYCHIPNEAKSYTYQVDTPNSSLYNLIKDITVKSGDYIEGFNEDVYKLQEDITYTLKKQYIFSWENDWDKELPQATDDESFNINTIVILYDIWNDNELKYSNIPMGIYVTGTFDENSIIQNSITKYVSNEDIFGSGTSYGLRICSKFISNPNSDIYTVKEVSLEDNNYADLSRVLSQLSISQQKMDEIINKSYNTDKNYKELLSIFKNSQTNVPYIKESNGKKYWFVNGKLISEISNCGDENNDGLKLSLTATTLKGESIIEKNTTDNDICVKWSVEYNGKKIEPEYISLNIDNNTLDLSSYKSNVYIDKFYSSNLDSRNYNITISYDNITTSSSVSILSVYPSYSGKIEDGHNLTADIIKGLSKQLYRSKKQIHQFNDETSSELLECTCKHIVMAYPKIYGWPTSITDNYGYSYTFNKENESIDNPGLNFEVNIINIDEVEYITIVDKIPTHVHNQIIKIN